MCTHSVSTLSPAVFANDILMFLSLCSDLRLNSITDDHYSKSAMMQASQGHLTVCLLTLNAHFSSVTLVCLEPRALFQDNIRGLMKQITFFPCFKTLFKWLFTTTFLLLSNQSLVVQRITIGSPLLGSTCQMMIHRT